MDLATIKFFLKQADIETELAHEDFTKKSAAHKAALQIINFEKDLYYGDASNNHHLKKIKEIIEVNVEDIINETN